MPSAAPLPPSGENQDHQTLLVQLKGRIGPVGTLGLGTVRPQHGSGSGVLTGVGGYRKALSVPFIFSWRLVNRLGREKLMPKWLQCGEAQARATHAPTHLKPVCARQRKGCP